jgi:hypothetical protein
MIDILAAIGVICVANLIISTIRNGRRKKPKQTCFVYCPRCHNELVSSNSFVEDKDGIVKYECDKCGKISFWDFIHYPVPYLRTCEADCKYGYEDEYGYSHCKSDNDDCFPHNMIGFEPRIKED